MRVFRSGMIVQHFKGMKYQILCIGENTETGEQMVVYQALYGEFKIWIRPLEMFVSEVDHEKYPEVKQVYRFEIIKE